MSKNNKQQSSLATQNDDSSKILAALSYPIWIIAIVSIATAKDNKYLKYHGFQALFWGISIFVIYIASMFFMMVPFLGIIAIFLLPVIWIGWLVCSIIFAVKAYQGEKFQIPLVYDITKSIAKELE